MSATNTLTIDPGGDWQSVVRQHIESLNFGSVQIVIQDSQVVEIDRTDKLRFAPMRKSRLRENANVPAPIALSPQSSLAVRARI